MKKQSPKSRARASARAARQRKAARKPPPSNEPTQSTWVGEFVTGAADAALGKVVETAVKAVVD